MINPHCDRYSNHCSNGVRSISYLKQEEIPECPFPILDLSGFRRLFEFRQGKEIRVFQLPNMEPQIKTRGKWRKNINYNMNIPS
jgi:hypothetical protein